MSIHMADMKSVVGSDRTSFFLPETQSETFESRPTQVLSSVVHWLSHLKAQYAEFKGQNRISLCNQTWTSPL